MKGDDRSSNNNQKISSWKGKSNLCSRNIKKPLESAATDSKASGKVEMLDTVVKKNGDVSDAIMADSVAPESLNRYIHVINTIEEIEPVEARLENEQ